MDLNLIFNAYYLTFLGSFIILDPFFQDLLLILKDIINDLNFIGFFSSKIHFILFFNQVFLIDFYIQKMDLFLDGLNNNY